MQILRGRRHKVEEVTFSRCGRWVAAGGYGGLHLWDTHDPGAKARHVTVGPFQPHSLAFRPDGRLFCRTMGAWILTDPESATTTYLRGPTDGAYAISPDGTRAVSVWVSGGLRAYHIGDRRVTAGRTVSASRTQFGGAAFSPDGGVLAVEETVGPGTTRRVVLRAAESGRRIARLPGSDWGGSRLLFSADGTRLVGWDRSAFACWAVGDPDRPPRVAANTTGMSFLSVAFHPAGALLTAGKDRLVRVWDADTLTVTRSIAWNVGVPHAVAVSPDGARAAVGSHTGRVLVWDWD